jgi:glycosyltransferase involved in cell wall biosynthesis
MVALLQRLQAVSLACLSHAIIVTAQDRREAIRRLVPIADRKVFVVPVGFNCPLYTLSNGEKKRLRAELGINEGDTVLLTFGTLQQAKRYEELIQAVSQLVRDGCSCKLVWLGDLDKYMTPGTQQRLERIMAFIDREGIASHIKLIGYCPPDEVSRYFNFADIYVHLDQSGASSKSGTLIGALAHGLPVVAADGLGADGFFRTDENIVLVPDTHAEHLADGIQALINAESLRHKLGQTARQFFELHFTWPMIAQQYEQVFGNLRRK